MRSEKEQASRLLAGLEGGSLPPADAVILAEDLDPVLVYVIVSFLRAVYPAGDRAATSVLERVVALTTASRAVIAKYRDGERDPISRWFEADYTYRDYRGRGAELVALVADKLDS